MPVKMKTTREVLDAIEHGLYEVKPGIASYEGYPIRLDEERRMRVLLLEVVLNNGDTIARIVEEPTEAELQVMLAAHGEFAAVGEKLQELEALEALLGEDTLLLKDVQGPFDHVVVFGSAY